MTSKRKKEYAERFFKEKGCAVIRLAEDAEYDHETIAAAPDKDAEVYYEACKDTLTE